MLYYSAIIAQENTFTHIISNYIFPKSLTMRFLSITAVLVNLVLLQGVAAQFCKPVNPTTCNYDDVGSYQSVYAT